MICCVIIFVALIVAFVIACFLEIIPDYIAEQHYIEYLKLRKEWLNNEHQCKYYKDNPLIKCHEKEGKEDCRWCPYIPFEEECKYYNI